MIITCYKTLISGCKNIFITSENSIAAEREFFSDEEFISTATTALSVFY